GVLLDDNNRKPLARLHFNRQQKYLGTFDAEKNETRHPIDALDDIFEFADIPKDTAKGYACSGARVGERGENAKTKRAARKQAAHQPTQPCAAHAPSARRYSTTISSSNSWAA